MKNVVNRASLGAKKTLKLNLKSIVQSKARWLFTLIALLTLGIGQMWGGSVSGGEIYFDATQSGWGNSLSSVDYIISHDSHSCWYAMTKIPNTNLYYISSGSWGDSKYFAFTANYGWTGSGDNCEDNSYDSRKGYGPSGKKYTAKSTYGVNSGSTYLFYASSSVDDASITTSSPAGYLGDGKTYTALNYTQTLNQTLSTNGGNTYSTSTASIATVKVSSYKLNGASSSTSTSGTIAAASSSTSCSAARTATVTYTVSSIATGYEFVGWYDGSTQKSTSTTYTYNATAAKTITARFKETQYSLTFSHNGHGTIEVGGSTISSGSTANVNHFTTKTLVATANTGYHFAGWTKSGSNTSAVTIGDESADGTSTTIKATNTGATITAVFEADASSYTLTFGAGSNGSVSAKNTSTEAALTSGSEYASETGVTVTATPDSHYHLEGWYSNSELTTPFAGAGTTNPYSFSLSSNISIYAKFALNQCAITLDRNGGTAGDESVTAIYGSTLPSYTAHTRSGYTLNGYFTATSGGTKIINADGTLVASTSYADGSSQWSSEASSLTLHAQWSENMRNVTISAGTGGTVDKTSASVGVATTTTVTATAYPGYKFTGWTATNCSVASSSSASTTLSGNGTTGDATLVANFERTYAYLEGRMTVYNAARSTETHVGSSEGKWSESSFNIAMDYDATNHRFSRHTYKTPAELSATQTDGTAQSQWFSIARSNASGSWSGKTTYHPSSNTDLTTAGIGQKKAAQTSTATANYKFNSSATDGYAILYFDEAGVWYELEHTLNYNANSGTGSAPAEAYYNHGVNATAAAANTFSRTGYTFNGWKTGASSGTAYAAGANVPMNSNITLYAQWQINNHAITYTAPSNGTYTIKVGDASAVSANTTSDYNKTVTLAANPATGYHFVSWSVTKTADASTVTITNNQFTMPDYPVTVSATFAANTYSVHFDGNGATSGEMSDQDFTYDAAQNLTANSYTRTGYDFDGWATATDGDKVYDDGENVNNLTTTNGGTFTLYAHWAAKSYTVTLDIEEANHGTIDGKATSASVTFDAAPTAIAAGQLPTAAQGYAFMGFYSAPNGKGSQFINADGTWVTTVTDTISDGKWVSPAIATLYAYYKKAEITNLVAAPGVIAPGETITITPTIEPTPTGTTKVCWEVQYSNGTPLPSQPTFTPGAGNAVSFPVPTASATYIIQAKLAKGSTCPAAVADVLSTRTTTFQVAGSHTVTVRYQDASGRTLQASGSVEARPLAWTEVENAITPPTITGYTFDHWDAGDGVTIKDDDSDDPVTTTTTSSIQIKANYPGTLTAVYNKKNMIYFNNTLGWSGVTVYFYKNDSYWDNNKGTGASTTKVYTDTPYSEGKHGTMTQIEGTNIYYFDTEEAGVNSTYTNIVFTELDQHGYEYFAKTKDVKNKVIRRGDYSTSLPMFVPLRGVEPTTMNNGLADYYNEGYWMNYPENTGYVLKIYDNTTWGSGDPIQSIPFEFNADKTLPMSVNVELNASRDYGFEIHRADGTVLGENSYTLESGDSGDDNETVRTIDGTTSERSKIRTAVAGDYIFKLNYGKVSSDHHFLIGVHYPVTTGDYRILYTDDAAWSKAAHSPNYVWWHESRTIHKENGAEDIVSFYVKYDSDTKMKFQYVSGINASTGAVTWADVLSGNIDLSDDITKDGVYNFYLSQTSDAIRVDSIRPYTGNYYIRTDCAGSTKWENFRTPDHQMTYSDYAETTSGYSHYFAHWVTSGTNVKFVIANDYSQCITDTLEADYGTPIADIASGGALNSASANIRFMWNQATNKISRAYIGGSSNITDRFLVLEGDTKMYDANGNALTGTNQDHRMQGNINTYLGTDNQVILNDDENFLYERTIKVNTGARAKLTAEYNDNVQYFKGSAGAFNEGTTVELLGGEADGQYTMRIVYDFKTNRLVTAYLPEEEISGKVAINADVMLIRNHQEAGQQLTFANSDAKLTNVKTVYGVMRFNRWTLNNKEKTGGHTPVGDPKSIYERSLYWISFPFDVNLGDVFGFGTYGVDWVIEYYDGAARALEGYWADSPGFWKMYTNRAGVKLEAGKGYVLAIDLDRMKDNNASFWINNIEQVELFFPSAANISTISQTTAHTTVAEHTCTIDRTNSGGTSTDILKNRTKADAHWNLIGVPSYANYGNTLTSDGSSATITWNTNPYTNDLPFLYEWNATDDSYTVQSGTTYPFKAMHAYMVQYHGDLYWSLASATPPASPIVARRTYAEKPMYEEFRLELQQNEKMVDQTFVKLSNDEEASANFVFNEDLTKEFNSRKGNIYTLIENYLPAAGNTLPMSEQTTIVPVGVKISTEGDYTFAMPEGTDGIGVTLIDNETGARTSLSALDYTVHLTAGEYTSRFVMEISPVQNTPTDIEEVPSDQVSSTPARKMLIDGVLYIVKDGKMFDARGASVK